MRSFESELYKIVAMCVLLTFNCTRWISWMARHCTWQTWIHPPGSDSRGVRSGPGPNPRSLPSPNRCRSRSNTCPHWCHGSRDETSRYWCTFMGCAKVLQKLGFKDLRKETNRLEIKRVTKCPTSIFVWNWNVWLLLPQLIRKPVDLISESPLLNGSVST